MGMFLLYGHQLDMAMLIFTVYTDKPYRRVLCKLSWGLGTFRGISL